MSALELEFRKEVTRVMNGLWLPTIHVESKLNPGVPDLSYVMNGNCETGWLELKQDESGKTDHLCVHVEPSQHRWMEAHAGRIPAHFLIARGRVVYLLNGVYHRDLRGPIDCEYLDQYAIGFQREALRANLYQYLTAITKRKQ